MHVSPADVASSPKHRVGMDTVLRLLPVLPCMQTPLSCLVCPVSPKHRELEWTQPCGPPPVSPPPHPACKHPSVVSPVLGTPSIESWNGHSPADTPCPPLHTNTPQLSRLSWESQAVSSGNQSKRSKRPPLPGGGTVFSGRGDESRRHSSGPEVNTARRPCLPASHRPLVQPFTAQEVLRFHFSFGKLSPQNGKGG